MRMAAYCRYSSDNQREESIDAQIRAIKEYCKAKGHTLVRTYVDEAVSATTDNRPRFLEMVKDAEARGFEAVIVHKLDRFARNRYDSAFYRHRLKESGVKVVSVLENFDDSPESIILESVIEGMNEYYSKNLSREVRKGMRETALQCRHNGGTPPLGYDVADDGKYIINETEAEAVRKAFELFLGGLGYGLIAEELSAAGYRAKRSGKPFGKNSIRDILLNEKYTGVHIYAKGTDHEIRIEDALPKIIDKETYLKVKMRIEKRKHEPIPNEHREYLLTGLLYCGECGSAFVGNGSYKARTGGRCPLYACTSKTAKRGCENPAIRKDKLEAHVINHIKEHLLAQGKLEALAVKVAKLANERAGSTASEIERLKRTKRDIETKVSRALDLYLDGGIDKELLDKKTEGLRAEMDLLTERILFMEVNAEKSTTAGEIKKRLRAFIVDLEIADFSKRKKVIAALVKDIKVYSNRVEAVFKLDADVCDSVGGERALLTIPQTFDLAEINKKWEYGRSPYPR